MDGTAMGCRLSAIATLGVVPIFAMHVFRFWMAAGTGPGVGDFISDSERHVEDGPPDASPRLLEAGSARHKIFYAKGNSGMERNNDNESRIPQNDPSKPMDSKREVEQSPDEKTDQDFPGYPHYPAREDIMDTRTDSHRVDLDVESLASGPNKTGVGQRFTARQRQGNTEGMNDNDLLATDSENSEIGTPQNVEADQLGSELPGTDLNDEVERFTTDGETTQYGTDDRKDRSGGGAPRNA